jgi:WD40 repeat protein
LIFSEARLRRERDLAREQGLLAQAEGEKAAAAARRAEANEAVTREHLYAADVLLAGRAIEDGNLGAARQALDRWLPEDGRPDLRGFEWHHFRRLATGDEALILRGHQKPVTTVAFLPDGTRLLTAGRDGTARFWSLPDGAPGAVLPPSTQSDRGLGEQARMALLLNASPEASRTVMSGVEEFAAYVLHARPCTTGNVEAAAVSRDGRWLATGMEWSYVRVWDLEARRPAFVIPANRVASLVFTPDSRHLVVHDSSPESRLQVAPLRVYDVATHEPVYIVSDVAGGVALAPGGDAIAVCMGGQRIEVRGLPGGRTMRAWQAAVRTLVYSPGGRYLAGIVHDSGGCEVLIWLADSGVLVGRIEARNEIVRAMAFSSGEDLPATAGTGHVVNLWTLPSLQRRGTLRGHGDEVLAVAWSPGGELLASGSKDGTVRLWRSEPIAAEDALESPGEPLLASPEGKLLAARSAGGDLRLWDLETRVSRRLPRAHRREALAFKVEPRAIVTLAVDSPGSQPALETWSPDGERLGGPVQVRGLQDEAFVLAGCGAAGVWAWARQKEAIEVMDLDTGAVVRRLDLSRIRVTRLVFSTGGKRLAAFTWPNHLRIWDLETGASRPLRDLPAGVVQAIAFSADARFFAAGGDDNVIGVWDASTGEKEAVLRGHKAEVKALAFAPGGRTLVSSSIDGTIRLWHLPTWRELGALRRSGLITYLELVDGGRTLLAGEHEGRLVRLRGDRTSAP